MTNQNLNNLLKNCTVKLSEPKSKKAGTGFFVARNLILTCYHVISGAENGFIDVLWYQDNQLINSKAKIIKQIYNTNEKINPDLALLELQDKEINHSFISFNSEINMGDALWGFGYPENAFTESESIDLSFVDITGGEIPLLKLHGQLVSKGYSGSPVLNIRTGAICGMITLRRVETNNSFATPTSTILSYFNELGHIKNDIWLKAQYGSILFILSEVITERTKFYYSTLLEEKHSMLLDINIEREKEIEEEDQAAKILKDYNKDRDKIKTIKNVWEPINLLEILESKDDYILVNSSGMGKTTYLKFIELQILKLLKSNIENNIQYVLYIPLFVTSNQLNKASEKLQTLLQEDYHYKDLLTKGLIKEDFSNIILIIDGLDQAEKQGAIINSFKLERMSNYRKARIIISSREDASKLISENFKRIKLLLPNKDEVIKYLEHKNFEKIEHFIEESEELITVPILLKMLKTILDKEDISSINYKTDLYNQFTDILIKEEQGKNRERPLPVINFLQSTDNVWSYFERISFKSIIKGEILEIDNKFIFDEFPKRSNSDIDAFKEQIILNIGIITELFETDQNKGKSSFRHQSFQAYFAARYIKKNCPDLIEKIIKDISFIYSDVWQEVIRFFIGLEDNNTRLEHIIKGLHSPNDDLLNKRLIFSINCLNETGLKISFENRLINELIEDIFRMDYLRSSAFQQINLLKNTTMANSIINLIKPYLNKTEGYHLEYKSTVIDIIGKIGNYKHVDIILTFVSYRTERIKSKAISSISQIGNHKNVDALIPLITKGNRPDLNLAFVKLVSNIGKPKDTPLLRLLLINKRFEYKHECIVGFGNIGSLKDLNFLKQVKNYHLYDFTEEAIANILSRTDRTKLRIHLNDKSIIVQRAAIIALGRIGTSDDTYLLRKFISDKDQRIKINALETLKKIGTKKDLELIMPLLQRKIISNEIKIALAKLIGKIGGESELVWLKGLLTEDSLDIQLAALISIAQLGISESKIIILDLFMQLNKFEYQDYNNSSSGKNFLLNRETVSTLLQSFGNVASDKDVLLLIPFLRSTHNYWQRLAAAAFKQCCSHTNIKILLDLLDNRSEFIQDLAINIILSITEDTYVDLIRSKLTIYKPMQYINFLNTNGKISDIITLKQFFNHKDYHVETNAIKAILQIHERHSKENVSKFLENYLQDSLASHP